MNMKTGALGRRLDRLNKIFPYVIPDWFPPTTTLQERERWLSIEKCYKGLARSERLLEFTRELRLRYPSMRFGWMEEMDAYGEELRRDPLLRMLEGLDPLPETMDPQVLQDYGKKKRGELFRKYHMKT